MTDKQFNIHFQWKAFIERCNLKEDQLPPDQQREMKRAFYGACGQMLILLRDDLGDLAQKIGGVKGELVAASILQIMLEQVGDFWETETEKQKP